MNLEYSSDVAKIIQSYIIDCNVENIYANLLNNGAVYNAINKSKLHSPFIDLLESSPPSITYGIDLPVFIKSTQPHVTTVMICAMDPLPPEPNSPFWNDKNIDLEKEVGFGTPFNIGGDLTNPKGSMKSNIPFFRSLNEKYQLYITDIFKLFFRMQASDGLLSSNSYHPFTELKKGNKNIHASILAEEIRIVKPNAIITLGSASISKLLEMNQLKNGFAQQKKNFTDSLNFYKWNNEIPIVSSPHISGAANGAKSKIINQEIHKDLVSKYQNEKLALIIRKSIL
jgi:uracil-DNA glycosylase